MNDAISKANVRYLDGSIVEDPMEEALITADNLRIYPVRDSIPVMLVEQSILTDQLGSAWLARLSSSDMEAP
jgi:uncharacterized protein YbaR (Trm112 family)